MAVKANDQITVVDLTDAYSVMLSLDAVSLNGSTSTLGSQQTVTVNVSAFCGNEQVTPTVGTPTCPTNVSASVGSVSNYVVPVTITFASALAASGIVEIPVTVDDVTINKQFSFSISFKGATGTYATSVICGNESVSIACDEDEKTSAASTITIPFAGYYGTSRKACTVAASGLPTGITAGTNTAATTSADGSLTLNVASGSTLDGNASGEITLTFTCNGLTFVKKLSWAKAITGATGATGETGATGATGTSATSVICGNESASIACTLDGLVKAAQTITIPFAGYIGTSRAACSVAVSGLPSGITTKTNTAATTSADGSLVLSVVASATLGSATTYNGEITLTFTCNSQTFVKKFSWSKALTGATGATGETGAAGEDAITIVITSSNGIIFKNTSIATTLTAHVYQGGAELSSSEISALGTVKWYKDGSSTALSTTGTTLTISAGDVTNTATYEARLEE